MQCKKCGTDLTYENVCSEEESTCIDCCDCNEYDESGSNSGAQCKN